MTVKISILDKKCVYTVHTYMFISATVAQWVTQRTLVLTQVQADR